MGRGGEGGKENMANVKGGEGVRGGGEGRYPDSHEPDNAIFFLF